MNINIRFSQDIDPRCRHSAELLIKSLNLNPSLMHETQVFDPNEHAFINIFGIYIPIDRIAVSER